MDQVTDNIGMGRFELAIDHESSAFAYYLVEDGRVVLTHTEVPFEHSGQGLATKLADGVFAALMRDGRKVVPKCGFMVAYALKHPEFNAIVEW